MGPPPLVTRLASGRVVFDGAMATMLRRLGWPASRPVELANVEAPHLVRQIHAAYREAGALVLTANTFGAHGLRPDVLALAPRVEELWRAARPGEPGGVCCAHETYRSCACRASPGRSRSG